MVFELKPNTGKTKWRETVPYRFCSKIGCTDGHTDQLGPTKRRSVPTPLIARLRAPPVQSCDYRITEGG